LDAHGKALGLLHLTDCSGTVATVQKTLQEFTFGGAGDEMELGHGGGRMNLWKT